MKSERLAALVSGFSALEACEKAYILGFSRGLAAAARRNDSPEPGSSCTGKADPRKDGASPREQGIKMKKTVRDS